MTTIYVTHPRYKDHQMQGYHHPENPARIEAVWELLADTGLVERMHSITPDPVSDQMIMRVHTQAHLDKLSMIAAADRMMMFDQDTYALPTSPEIARLAAGGVVAAVDAVLSGEADNGLAAVRPPGHHATGQRAMGFCLLNNVAIGVRQAQVEHDIKRVMIVDYDVHHGNGTQDIFYEDPDVLFISTHQYPFYPGTGALNEVGIGAGHGTTLNIPLSAGIGDQGYRRIYQQIVWPAARRFKPELILVSAGFDAHHIDPLAMMRLTHTGYAHLTRELITMAETFCEGKIVFVMEGGYDLPALAHGVRNIAHALLGDETVSDHYGAAPAGDPDVTDLIQQVRQRHNLRD